jgi:5-methylcytosine-specific restriction enzyme B
MADPITIFDGLDSSSIDRMSQAISNAYENATSASFEEAAEQDDGSPNLRSLPEAAHLIGIDPSVYRQVNAALAAGCKNFMFYGPPGTGKTTLAQWLAQNISTSWKLITGSADWTSQDIIGGYHPLSGGNIVFKPGALLENLDKPLVFDELNRCDIDKVIGPLFTVLSGQGTTLPYVVDPSSEDSPRIEINPQGTPTPPYIFVPSPKWRFIATINSIDKASLYQMSYALTRRFAWIYVDIPSDPVAFLRRFIARELSQPEPPENTPVVLAEIWKTVNGIRPIGPAPIIDIFKVIRASDSNINFFAPSSPAASTAYLDGFYMFILPMLDGISKGEADKLTRDIPPLIYATPGDSSILKSRIDAMTI